MKMRFQPVFFWLIGLIIISACKKDDNHIEYVNNQIYQKMQVDYLWYDHLPAIDPGSYSTPEAFMEALRYNVYDRWSFVMTEEEYNQYFEEGEMIGHGFLLGLDNEENVRVAFIYRNTEAEAKGVKRGWILSRINGTSVTKDNAFDLLGASEAGITNQITFLNENGDPVELSLTKEILSLTPVLHAEVINRGSHKIGYMVFQDFIESANEELDSVFGAFADSAITELVIDLRYNGGGSVLVAEHLAGWLIGKEHGGETFLYYEFNDKNTNKNRTDNVPSNANGLNLDRIFFIGTGNTASASELIINGVKPFVTSVLAGDTTHGKPVGMVGFRVSDYIAFPITFKYSNKDHEGDFYDGLAPDLPAEDDITRDFGNPEELSLKAVLDYIDGNMKVMNARIGKKPVIFAPKGHLNQFLKAY